MFEHSGEDMLHVVTIGDTKYEIEIDHHIDPEKISKILEADYAFDENDFAYDAIFIQRHTLRNIKDDPISEEQRERIIRLIFEHQKREYPNVEVTIE